MLNASPLDTPARELPSKEALYRAILASTLDPTITIDDRGTIVAASDSVERVFGYSHEELTGKNIKMLMPEPHHSAHDGYLDNYRRTGETHILGRTREFQVVHRNRELIDVDLSVSRVDFDGADGPLFIGSFRDVTERNRAVRALKANERRLNAMFDGSFQCIVLLDTNGILLEANKTALQGAEVTREEVIGHPFWDTPCWVATEESRPQLEDGVRRAAQGEFIRFEAEHLGPDGELRAMDVSLTPVGGDHGQIVQIIAEGRDITEFKRAQRAETAMLRSLATIGESAAVLAHEIKNPITSVNVALRAVADQLGEDHQVVLSDLVGRMQRLERVMRRTLSFTRPVTLKRADVDGFALLNDAVHDLRPAVEQAGVEVSVEPSADPVELSADPQLLGEVLTNLISNAVEALPEGGRVSLSVGREQDEVVFTVEDDGPGVPDSLRDTLFKPFYTTKSKGSGLGLAFCRKVVDEHGGSIAVENGEGGGARFTVRMPSPAPRSP